MLAATVLAPYLVAVALFFAISTPVWPGLLVACAVAARVNRRAALTLAVGTLALQYSKASFDAHLWVYYAATFAPIGFVSLAVIDKIAGITSLLIALAFVFVHPDLAEVIYMLGLLLAVYRGPTGGIYAGVFRPAREPAGGALGDSACLRGCAMGGANGGGDGVLRLDYPDRAPVLGKGS
ncbi:MAG: hypothetical protein GY717_20915 [Rhodobacteraceae bacterium]|nr:hypothetical protein [Paracoccaceae bacterium]